MTEQLIDPFQRAISYLRVSVTDRCDFRCVYCMSENMTFLPKKELLTLEELDRMCSTFVRMGVEKLRITGGEPLVRKGIMTFFNAMTRHLDSGALKELTLTTNGSQLERFADDLYAAGVRRVNISLDTLDEAKFADITRWGRLPQVIKGIDAAQRAGLRVKINTVALKGFNEDELFTLVEWCRPRHGPHLHRGDADGGYRQRGPARSVLEAVGPARAPRRGVYADRSRGKQRRPGALCAAGGNRAEDRLHHAAHA